MRAGISPILKQMGILIHTSFQTPEGFSITGVYCRIIEFAFRPHSNGQFAISYRLEYHIDRQARLSGKLPIRIPTLGDGQTFVGNFGDMPYVYGVLKTNLQDAGFTVEDVLE